MTSQQTEDEWVWIKSDKIPSHDELQGAAADWKKCDMM